MEFYGIVIFFIILDIYGREGGGNTGSTAILRYQNMLLECIL